MRKWIPLIAICLGTFMLLVDVSIVNVALPDMASDLHSSFTSLQWVVDMYALVLAALLMVVGALGDRLGHRRLYLAGLAVFALASLACGLAPDAATLIAARAAQGVGGAAMLTSTTSLLNAAYQGRDRGTAFGIWGAVSGGAAAVGPVLGGLLTGQIDWRAIFYVNLPIAALAIVMTLRHLKSDQGHGRGRLDYLGAIAFTAFSGALVYALIEGADQGWGSSTVLTWLGVAALALVAFVLVELRVPHPLLELSLLRNRSFVGLTLAALLINAAAFAHLTYTGIWMQSVLGLSPIQAGLAICPLALAAFVVSGNNARIFRKAPPQLAIGLGLLLVGAGALLMTLVSPGSSWTAALPGLIVSGLGVGAAMPVMMSAALGSVPRERVGMASGVVNTGRQLGYALGIAVLGTFFANRVQSYVTGHGHLADPHGTASALSGGRAQAVLAGVPADRRDAVQGLVHSAFAAGLDRVYLIAGVTGIVAGLLVLALVRRGEPAPWERKPEPAGDQTEAAQPSKVS
ncbi:MFS transporter [Streptacidiphilus carbonis]|uniref:MFS transporter n=1 Tax=Streptacidiphilus carbonis TaxID=105422 RepID=UPI0005A8A0B8|nr:MFS transporter [Streptacidiphilus carbonis]